MAVTAERRRQPRKAKSSGRKLFAHDRSFGARFVAGADEAGRGCLAGPLVAGGVLLDLHRIGPRDVRALARLNDSKKLSDEAREELLPVILAAAAKVVVISRSAVTIDTSGLHVNNLAALREALRAVAVPGAVCLSDGFSVGEIEGCVSQPLVGGDAKSAAIAAASIVAKVSRDRYMLRQSEIYPEWGFDEHVGYSTPMHREAITRHGITPLHRRSFASAAYQQLTL